MANNSDKIFWRSSGTNFKLFYVIFKLNISKQYATIRIMILSQIPAQNLSTAVGQVMKHYQLENGGRNLLKLT